MLPSVGRRDFRGGYFRSSIGGRDTDPSVWGCSIAILPVSQDVILLVIRVVFEVRTVELLVGRRLFTLGAARYRTTHQGGKIALGAVAWADSKLAISP